MLKINISDDLLETFNALQQTSKKKGRKAKQIAWATFKIDNDKFINNKNALLVDYSEKDTPDWEAVHKDFIANLKDCAPAYGCVDLKGKVFFTSYIPETCKVREKMTYSSVRQTLKDGLSGVNHDIAATDDGALAWDEFNSKIKVIS